MGSYRSEESRNKRRERARAKWADNKEELNSKKRDYYHRTIEQRRISKNASYDPIRRKIYRDKPEIKSRQKTYMKDYRSKNAEKIKEKQVLRFLKSETKEQRRNYKLENWKKEILSNVKKDALRKGVEFLITESDIEDPFNKSCPCFSTQFKIGDRKSVPTSATVDRIDPNKGYIPGNVWVVSKLFNSIKNDADPEIIMRVGLTVQKAEMCKSIVIDTSEDTRKKRQKMVSQKRRSNKKHLNHEFTIDWTNITLPEFCPCIGVKLDYNNEFKDWKNWASIDRIDNSFGYIPGNVWVISNYANTIKNEANSEQIIRVAKTLTSIHAAHQPK